MLYDWIVERYDGIKTRVPEDQLPFLTWGLVGADPALIERARSFFLDPSRKTRLTEIEFQKVTEWVAIRAVLRERAGDSVSVRVKQLNAQLDSKLR
jgi:hypothetical protein